MILNALTVAELKLLARARGIDPKGASGRDALVYRIEQEFFRSPHLLPHLLQDLPPPARAILDYMGVVGTEVTVHEICAFLRLRGFIKSSRPTLVQETYWELIKRELILKGLVIITRKLEEYPVAKRDEWCWYRLAIPPQFLPQIPLPK
ncbi:MAG: hypothetical protein HYY20_05000, partial [Candidatus Tectomicrobia bacterium]|nr:hypothetical protein [Candidatus Tectomicrobia bacterium]